MNSLCFSCFSFLIIFSYYLSKKKKKKVSVGTFKEIVNSKQKELRELKSLFSSINYDGVASKGRYKDFSLGSGVITSFK